ncbi:16235_t:CDS:10, partial [Dentiscutata erythropus]
TIINIEVHQRVMDLKDIDGEEKGKITDLMSIDAQKVSSMKYKNTHENLMEATDKRLEVTNELLQSIRDVKLFASEDHFLKNITDARNFELNQLKDRMRKSIYMGILCTILPFLMILPTFANHKLTAPIAFAAITVYVNLHNAFDNLPYQIICFIQAHVSISRVEKFLKVSEIVQNYSSRNDGTIGFKKATLQWPNNSNNFKLKELDVIFPPGKLSLIHGPTGCGKSALLKALLGEMKCLDGSVHFPNEVDIAYVSQTAWLQNGTIRNNILFGSDFIAERYSEVKSICDLTFDDEAEIGERGITLSDGQKQRIALARAIYSNHNIMILDNCLSAVDSCTEKYIYEKCLRSSLMKNRTRIFVTHHENFYGAALKVFMKDGMIINKKEYLETEELHSNFKEDEYIKLPDIKYDNKLFKEEVKAKGRVKLGAYVTYLNSSKFYWLFIIILVARFVQTLQDFLIREWTKVYDNKDPNFFTNNITHKSRNDDNYFIFYASLGFLEIFLTLLGSYLTIKFALKPSKKLHKNLLKNILFAKIKFYDTTPIGLEAINRSSIYAAFDNTIEGRSIIRTFGARERFYKNLRDLMDCYNRPILMNWACNQWMHEKDLNTNESPPEWPAKGKIEVENLGVKYSNNGPTVLRNISFKISAGEKIGIVGRTGSGKSTLVKSIFRIMNPTDGQIKIDGTDISTINLSCLRKKITIIPQNPKLFNGTLRSNIDFSGEHTDHELWEVLRKARLVEGHTSTNQESNRNVNLLTLDTIIREGGCNLSHGQQQLIMLARAFINKSKVIILDEATANVDLETDLKIQETIREEFKDSTLLCITHRLKTVINYDRILVLDSGYIVESGHPRELLQDRESMFKQMCMQSMQSKEFNDLLLNMD